MSTTPLIDNQFFFNNLFVRVFNPNKSLIQNSKTTIIWNAKIKCDDEWDHNLIVENVLKSEDDLKFNSEVKWGYMKSVLNLKNIQRNAVMQYIRANLNCNLWLKGEDNKRIWQIQDSQIIAKKQITSWF